MAATRVIPLPAAQRPRATALEPRPRANWRSIAVGIAFGLPAWCGVGLLAWFLL